MGKYCQDEQLQFNKGTTRKLEPGILEEMDFKISKYGSEVKTMLKNQKLQRRSSFCLRHINLFNICGKL